MVLRETANNSGFILLTNYQDHMVDHRIYLKSKLSYDTYMRLTNPDWKSFKEDKNKKKNNN